MPVKQTFRVEHFGYCFIGLLPLTFAGFWPSYFSKFFNGTANFSSYFHVHAAVALLWIAVLIAQPVLIRKKKLWLHRAVGKSTYVLFPLLCISILLLAHSRHRPDEQELGFRLFGTFRDLFVLIVVYSIGLWHKRNYFVHARAMIATGLVFILPSLVRIFMHAGVGFSTFLLLGIGSFYLLLVGLIIAERKQIKGRWVFPLVLGLFAVSHLILFAGIRIPLWEAFCKWFIALPLT